LEDVVARIDTPLLGSLNITFFHQLIFDTPQLAQFISRAPSFKVRDEAHVHFSNSYGLVLLPSVDQEVRLEISCSRPDWQLSSLAQVYNSSVSQVLMPALERLYLAEDGDLEWQDDIENDQWLELFHPFTTVKDLYISSEFTPRVAPALQELIGERATEVLPALQTLFLREPLPSGPVQEAIEQFVAARQLASRPVSVSVWERED
jgi:hypothetical protein